MQQQEILNIFTAEMKTKLGERLKKIILFGSRARGDHDPDSDYDLLVVLDEISPSITDMVDEIGGDILYRYNSVFAVMPIVENKINKTPFEPFLINALKEGLVCYEAA